MSLLVLSSSRSPSRRSVAAPAWTPASITGLTLWLDAATPATMLNSGGTQATAGQKVATWNDRSTNGNNVAQGTDAQRPTLTAAQINGIACPVFNGAATNLVAPFAIDNDWTVVVVALVNADGIIWGQAPTGVSISLRANVTSKYCNCQTKDSTKRLQWAWPAAESSGGHIFDCQPVALGANLLVDNGSLTSSAGFFNNPSGTTLLIGGRASTLGLAGSIAEVIVVNQAISAPNRTAMNSYLAAKWGITLAA